MADSTPRRFLPQRPAVHVTGDQAVLAFRASLPPEWIVREVETDYGIDCEVEVVSDDGSVTGAMLLAQLKGTKAKAGQPHIVQVSTSTVRYWVSLPVPVIIVRVMGTPSTVRWLDVRHHLQETERLDGLFATRQATVSFNFTDAPVLPGSAADLGELAQEHQEAVLHMRDDGDRQLVGDFVAYHVFIEVFDGDIDRWLKWLRTDGGDNQVIHDYPFAVWLKSQLAEDPSLLDRIRQMVANTNPDGTEK